MIRGKTSHLYLSPAWAFVSLWITARYTTQRQNNLPSKWKPHSDKPKVCFHQKMSPRGWNLANHMQGNINFCVLFQADMLSVRWLFFPNMTIPLGRKLTLNKHFPCTLSDSCFLSSAVSLIYSFHLPSLSPSLISVSHFYLSYYYLHSFSSIFSSQMLPLSTYFPILYFLSFIFSLFFYFAISACYFFCPTQSIPHNLHPEKYMRTTFKVFL